MISPPPMVWRLAPGEDTGPLQGYGTGLRKCSGAPLTSVPTLGVGHEAQRHFPRRSAAKLTIGLGGSSDYRCYAVNAL